VEAVEEANQPSTLPPWRIGQLRHPRHNLRFHCRQPEQSSDFQKSSSSRLTRSTTSSPEEEDDASTSHSWTGLPAFSLASEKIAIGERKKLGEIIPLQHCRFCIIDASRKTKPQRSHTPLEKPNSTAKHQRRANPKPKWTQLRTQSTKGWTLAPLANGKEAEDEGESGPEVGGDDNSSSAHVAPQG
jgi:hypothetical protein